MILRYATVREQGPTTRAVFEVELSIQGEVVAWGPGEARKQNNRRRSRPPTARDLIRVAMVGMTSQPDKLLFQGG
jgi:hypothetical protein